MNGTDPRVVLIIHPGALGDVLLAVPAVRAIRSRYPSHVLVLLAGAEVGRLLQLCWVVDRVIPFESGDVTGLFSNAGCSPSLRHLLERCDAAIGWLRDIDGSLRATLETSGVPWIAVESPTPVPGIHQSDRFMEVVLSLQGGRPTEAGLPLPASLRQAGRDLLRSTGAEESDGFVVCHPGSGSPVKCVRPDVMAAAIRGFRELKLTPVVVGGPADDQAVIRVTEQGLQNLPVLRHQPLELLAGILANACLFLGHDSGVTHLAAALHVPTVALFGPTDPCQWAPRGEHVSVVRGSNCTCLDWGQVRNCHGRPCLPDSTEIILQAAAGVLPRYHSVTKS